MNEIELKMRQSRIKGDEMLIILKSFDDYCRLMMLYDVFIALIYSLSKCHELFLNYYLTLKIELKLFLIYFI